MNRLAATAKNPGTPGQQSGLSYKRPRSSEPVFFCGCTPREEGVHSLKVAAVFPQVVDIQPVSGASLLKPLGLSQTAVLGVLEALKQGCGRLNTAMSS